MKRPIQISIPAPCHENWAAMTPADKGRFCGACQKNVYDLTRMPDKEILAILSRENDVCGSLTSGQLERGLMIPNEKKNTWLAGVAAMALLTIGTNETVAQENVTSEQAPPNRMIRGKVLTRPQEAVIQPIEVKGAVYDETGMPLPDVIVTDTISKIEVTTDSNGKFTIKANEGNVLMVNFITYNTAYITVSSTNAEHILRLEEQWIGEIVYRRSFFGRIFQSIGDLFRSND